jgi:hypothetical protein
VGIKALLENSELLIFIPDNAGVNANVISIIQTKKLTIIFLEITQLLSIFIIITPRPT